MDETTVLLEIIKRSSRVLQPLPAGLKRRGDLSHRVKAVLFDLYGTLFISASGRFDAAGLSVEDQRPDKALRRNETALGVGVNHPAGLRDASLAASLSELLKTYGISGDPPSVLVRFRERVLGEHASMRKDGVDFPEVRIEEVWRDVLETGSVERARRFAVEYECLVNPVWPMPYAQALIGELHEAGVVLGIVSNAQFFTPLLFRAFFDAAEVEMGFDEKLILYSYMQGRAKPSPLLFEKARGILLERSILPENVLFVGNDTASDLLPACRTGFQTALFCGDRRSLKTGDAGPKSDEPEHAEPGACRRFPDLLVTSLEELSALLRQGPAGQDSSQRTS
jgi:putative hydrolase of the HAD superfamily